MILFFSDTHLGLKSHSIQNEDGIYSAEQDCMFALNNIAERLSKPDIDMLIFGGDMAHTNNPTPQIINFLIGWFQKINTIGKPCYFITGNHDTSMYSNSIVYTNNLKLKNIHLCDKLDPIESISWNDWYIKFIPYIPNKSLKDKDILVEEALNKAIQTSSDKTMIVSHLQEISSQIGSECRMLSRGVPLLDKSTISANKKFLFLLGHIHMHQIYGSPSVKVVYPGSPTYMDATDINTKKGYCLIDSNGDITFEEITGIRRFIKYSIPDDISPIEHLKTMRILSNSVAFLDYFFNEKVDTKELYKFFKSKNCLIGSVKKRTKPLSQDVNNIFITNKKSHQDTFIDYVKTGVFSVDKEKLIKRGLDRLERFIEVSK